MPSRAGLPIYGIHTCPFSPAPHPMFTLQRPASLHLPPQSSPSSFNTCRFLYLGLLNFFSTHIPVPFFISHLHHNMQRRRRHARTRSYNNCARGPP
ncbi:hypothetical protein PLESTB_001454900 [Pleodorina starrii]|uniref:Uncharacterized protein n=1 Tax=Pleodorina starrii TaxID=330485 RepID=A0A9W6F7Z7_9CHLO|nr:hypothetical protein PLESTB_001454900 [Pleodorina starrii]